MDGSLTMRMPVGTTNISGMTFETQLAVKLSPEGAGATNTADAETCDCRYCQEIVRHALNGQISPIAAIDVYSLPEETEQLA